MNARVVGTGMWLALCASSLGAAIFEEQSADASASIALVSETPTQLSMKFTDATGSAVTLKFTRPDVDSAWSPLAPAPAGIVFGNPDIEFADSDFLYDHGIIELCGLTSFDSSFSTLPVEDITIFSIHAGDMAIGVWNYGKITHIGWAGELVADFVEAVQSGEGGPTNRSCSILKSICCRKEKPRLSACEVAAQHCPDYKDAVCSCLNSLCKEGTEQGERACEIHATHCGDPPPPKPDPIEELLKEILRRLQQLERILACHAAGGVWNPATGECEKPDPPQPPTPPVGAECIGGVSSN